MHDLSARNELAWLARLVADIRAAVPDIDLLVVGALARDLLLHYAHGIRITRATQDADFAIAADWPTFDRHHQALLASGRFEARRGVRHKLRHKEFGWIDLIPFGAVERADGSIAWPPAGDEVMDVLGYSEAAAAAVHFILPGNQSLAVVSLPMLAVLKVFAWRDRHRTTRGKDGADLQLVLSHYLEAGNTDRLYSEFAHLIDDEFDFDETGGWLLGHDARQQVERHGNRLTVIASQLDAVLGPELDQGREPRLVVQMRPDAPDVARFVLSAFRRGLCGDPLRPRAAARNRTR